VIFQFKIRIKMKIKFCFIILIENLFPVLTLNIVHFDVPQSSKFGDSVELSCIYDLKKDRLYSVKVFFFFNFFFFFEKLIFLI
jgi:hypothetical protein